MRDKCQKKLQKNINTAIKKMNDNIYKDDLWLGRFYGHQIQSRYYKFDDGSGGVLSAVIELVDNKTGITKIVIIDTFGQSMFLDWDIWKEMNTFIIEDCDVWGDKDDDPRTNRIDYRNVRRR